VETGYADQATKDAARFGNLLKRGGIQQMLAQMGGRLGAGISDADRAAIQQTTIGLENNLDYNKDAVEMVIKMQERAIAAAEFAKKYGRDPDFASRLAEWSKGQPSVVPAGLSEKLKSDGLAATSPTNTSVSGNVIFNKQTGQRMRPSADGKSWVAF
jgi:hypothetical protein